MSGTDLQDLPRGRHRAVDDFPIWRLVVAAVTAVVALTAIGFSVAHDTAADAGCLIVTAALLVLLAVADRHTLNFRSLAQRLGQARRAQATGTTSTRPLPGGGPRRGTPE